MRSAIDGALQRRNIMAERSEFLPDREYSVVQWATGTVGTKALRCVIQHPRLRLVGVKVHSAAKEGKDAGELCGLPPIGVYATRDIAAVLALKPDCVLYMPEGCNLDELCQILEAGINVVTTRGELLNPAAMDEAARARLEAACRKGNASIHATGSSPGFVTEALPLALLSIQRHLDCLTIDEYADIVPACSADMIFTVMGFGEAPEQFMKRDQSQENECFAHSLSLLADALNLPFDEVRFSHEIACATAPWAVGDKVLPAGGVAGLRLTVSGMHEGRAVLRFRTNWFVTRDLDEDWGPLRPHGWRVVVEGDAPMTVDISFPPAASASTDTLAGYTAHRPVNAIAAVCEARPGIVTSIELPHIVPILK